MSRPNLSLLLLASLMALPALAGDKPRVVVVPFGAGDGASDGAGAKFTGLVVDELKRRDGVQLTGQKDKAGKPGTNVEAAAAFEAGRKAFEDLRFDDAAPSFKKALESALADPATADFEAVIDGYVKLAAASFRMGEEKDAKSALTDLCRLAPAYELPAGYPPVFVHELEKAKHRIEKQQKGLVSIDGAPGATAFLDGRDLGMLPIIEEPVTVGVHYVRVEGTKGERFGQAVDVKGSAKVHAAFVAKVNEAPIEPPRVAAMIDERTQQRLVAYARSVNADYALVGYVYKPSESPYTVGAALFSVKKNAFTALQTVSFEGDVPSASTEASRLADDLGRRLTAFAPAALPINLALRVKQAKVEPKPAPVETEPVAPPKQKKPVTLVPDEPVATSRAFDKPSVLEAHTANADQEDRQKPPEVKPAAVPTWVWVVTGVAVAAGIGVGGYFGYTAITKPVSGTVTATW